MKLIRIALAKEDSGMLQRFERILHKQIQSVNGHHLFFYRIELREEAEWYVFCCRFWPRMGQAADALAGIRKQVSAAIAEFIVKYKEKECLKEILDQEYGCRDETEADRMIHFILNLLNTDEHGLEYSLARELKLQEKIAAIAEVYLFRENQLTIDGFVRFRLKQQWEEWRKAVHHGMDEYLLNKEYQDFIDMLRSLVSVQEAQVDLLHIVHIDDRNLLLFDGGWGRFFPRVSPPKGWTRKLSDYEDFIIHALISAAPDRIVIHTQQQSHHIIYMIRKIFAERVDICSLCTQCQRKMSGDFTSFPFEG